MKKRKTFEHFPFVELSSLFSFFLHVGRVTQKPLLRCCTTRWFVSSEGNLRQQKVFRHNFFRQLKISFSCSELAKINLSKKKKQEEYSSSGLPFLPTFQHARANSHLKLIILKDFIRARCFINSIIGLCWPRHSVVRTIFVCELFCYHTTAPSAQIFYLSHPFSLCYPLPARQKTNKFSLLSWKLKTSRFSLHSSWAH